MNTTESIPKHWFYTSLSRSGEITRRESDSPEGFLDAIGCSELAWVDFWTDDIEKDLPIVAGQMGFSEMLSTTLLGQNYSTYEDLDTEMGLRLPTIHVYRFEVKSRPLLLFLKNNFILSVHPLTRDRRFARLRRYSETVIRKIPRDVPLADKITLLVMRIIDENNDRNFDELRKIEEQGDQLHESLSDPNISRGKIAPEIYQMKHALITYLDALWECADVVNALRYGDAEIITDDPGLLNRMGILAATIGRQISLAEHMSEVLSSGLEVLQSIYNNQLQALNNRLALVMTYLTILGTAVLVPNTLATIFSNSAFALGPRDVGWYVSLIVGSTIVSTALAWRWVKKRGRLPPKMD